MSWSKLNLKMCGVLFFVICHYFVRFEITNVHAYQSLVQHSGDIIVASNEVLVIDSTEYRQNGNVLVMGNGNLTIINSGFSMTAEMRTYITLTDNATLKAVNSELTSQVHILHFRCYNNSRVSFENTTFGFWGSTVIEMWGNSTAFFEESSQKKWVQVETHDTATVAVKNSTIAMIECSASSTLFLQNSYVTKGSSCTESATLTLKHSSFQSWLYVEDSAKLVATENSTIGTLWPLDSSNVTINDSHVSYISPSDSSNILLTNGSSVNILTINMQSGYSRISDLRNGHIKNYTIHQERTDLNVNILESSVNSFDLKVGSNSHLFLEDSGIYTLSVSSFGSATVYNSEVKLVYCDDNSLLIMWNSKASLPIQSQPNATVKYFSTVSLTLFYTVVAIATVLAIALTLAIVKIIM